MLKVEIYRYNPDTDKAPYMKTYEFDTQGKDLMVLDVLEQSQKHPCHVMKDRRIDYKS